MSLGQRAVEKRTALQNMRAVKQAIPTPFGNFEVSPKLALMALAFAAVLTYLIFITSVFRLYTITRQCLILGERNESDFLGRSPPFWLYGRGSSNFSSLFSSPNLSRPSLAMFSLFASFLFHTGWLMFAGWLVYQSWIWKSSEALLFENKHLSNYILFILLTIAVLLSLRHFIPNFSKETLSNFKPMTGLSKKTISRRAFLGSSITILIAGTAYYFGLRNTSKRAKICTTESGSTFFKGYEKDFISNRRTRTLHHRIACRNHLPCPNNWVQDDVSSNLYCLHASYGWRIFDQLATRDVANKDYEPAIAHLQRAIELSPFCYHLYDRLIGLYGRLKQHDKIEILLQVALQRVREVKQQCMSLKPGRLHRIQKQMKRAEEEFQLRYNTYNKHQRCPVK